MSPPNYDAYQQVLALSAGSNLVRTGTKFTEYELQTILLDKLDGRDDHWLTDNVGVGWSIVWGPAVWRSKPGAGTFPDNVWFVAKNDLFAVNGETPTRTYVVAIAGSTGEPRKSFDWKTEDFAVKDVVDLQAWLQLPRPGGVLPEYPTPSKHADPSKPLLSHGTAVGVHVLATKPPASPPDTAASNDSVSLCTFFQELKPPADSKLIFTGHSLGGTLSPGLAVTLMDGGYLDKFKGNTLVYPTAGASPGNGHFATHFSELFPAPPCTPGSKFYQTWNQNIVNTLDIVPHAWCTSQNNPLNLFKVPGIYGNSVSPHPRHPMVWLEIEIVISILCGKSFASGAGPHVYQPLVASTFSGRIPPIPSTRDLYVKAARDQHVDGYGFAIIGKPFPDPVVGRKEDDPLLFNGILGTVTGSIRFPDDYYEDPELRRDEFRDL